MRSTNLIDEVIIPCLENKGLTELPAKWQMMFLHLYKKIIFVLLMCLQNMTCFYKPLSWQLMDTQRSTWRTNLITVTTAKLQSTEMEEWTSSSRMAGGVVQPYDVGERKMYNGKCLEGSQNYQCYQPWYQTSSTYRSISWQWPFIFWSKRMFAVYQRKKRKLVTRLMKKVT